MRFPRASSPRSGAPFFGHVEAVPEPAAALARARELAGEDALLVTGSLYLLADLRLRPPVVSTMASVGERLSVFVLAAIVLFAIVAIAFGAGWFVGKILL